MTSNTSNIRKTPASNTYDQRLHRLRNSLRHSRQAILVARQPDLRYLTGFTGQDSMLLITSRQVFLITDSRFAEQAARQCPSVKTVVRHGPINEPIARLCKKSQLTHIRRCTAQVSVAFDRALRKSLTGQKLRLTNCPALATTLRVSKDANELAAIEMAVKIAEKAFNWLKYRIKAGITEKRLAAMLEYKMKLLGSEDMPFETIVAVGPNSALPHAPVGQDVVTVGKPIIFDFGATVDGYCSDLTRTVVLGTIPHRLRKIYNTVLEAQKRAIAAIKHGVTCKAVDRQARSFIRGAGFGKYFGHGLGHGIGLEVHEQPVLHPHSDTTLQVGMIVTVEPGIYIPSYAGVRIEDDVLVTDSGCRVLSSLDKQVSQIVISS